MSLRLRAWGLGREYVEKGNFVSVGDGDLFISFCFNGLCARPLPPMPSELMKEGREKTGCGGWLSV